MCTLLLKLYVTRNGSYSMTVFTSYKNNKCYVVSPVKKEKEKFNVHVFHPVGLCT